ncbi:MAG: triose-phosphate isomerase [Desulfurococcales archaeon]|nr:triose-phosphate isomerase [Desulfurococcales archaeon]
MIPVFVVNYKAYPTSYGKIAEEIAKKASDLSSTGRIRIILAVPATEVYRISKIHEDTYIQSVDSVIEGSYTGHITVEMAEEAGAKGVLLNHSEKKLLYRDIQSIIKVTRIETLVCAETPEEAVAVSLLNPTMIAIEPPELIGTGIPVSKAKPQVITDTVRLVRQHNTQSAILTGAGISAPGDAIKAIQLGTQGVLVASAVMKAQNPLAKLEEFAEKMII